MRLFLVIRRPMCDDARDDIDPVEIARLARELRNHAEEFLKELTGKDIEIIVDYVRSQ